MQSKLFLRNITVLDHCFIDDVGMIHGNSFLVSCKVSGKVEGEEQVVIDFSKCKKQLKDIIDDKENGFDHKLLLYENDSKYVIKDFDESRVTLETPFLQANLPSNAIRIIPNTTGYFSSYITEKMQEFYPDADINVEVEMATKGFSDSNYYFTYSHGLRNSSAFGCQNITHGHLSFIEVVGKVGDLEISIPKISDMIKDYLNDVVFVYQNNILSQTSDSFTIGYNSKDRGFFTITYKQPHRIIILQTETTIENIIEHVKNVFITFLKGKTLRISEGLSKGSEIEC